MEMGQLDPVLPEFEEGSFEKANSVLGRDRTKQGAEGDCI